METIIDNNGITLDYDTWRDDKYRITTYDKFGHYEGEIYVRAEQLYELMVGLEKIEKRLSKEMIY
jgi:hypothetical protein